MSTIPKFASNKKYWQILNKLVFGDEVSCPRCRTSLQESYCNKYLWRKLCRKKYRPTSYRASWLYGMKLSPQQLFILLYCWQTKRSTETSYLLAGVSYTTVRRWFARFRKQLPDSRWIARANQPELFASPIAFLRFTMALRVSWVNSNRFATLAIYYKYSLTILSANSIADFIVFSRL